MINFFRQIRKSLFMKNKTGKYFKYAIGEIFLVVIGILIALSINNWNENRQNRKVLTIYTNQLIEEVEINVAQLNNIVKNETKLVKHLDTVVSLLNKQDYDNIKLKNKSYALLTFEDFNPETIAYDNLKSSGEFKLIENIELRNAISGAYNTFEDVKLTQEVHYYNMKTRVADYFLENADYGNFQHTSTDFAKDRVFKNLTLGSVATFNQKIEACKNSLESLKELKTKLEYFSNNEL